MPLRVARGFSSLSFLADAATEMEADGKDVYVYRLGDHDPSGRSAGEAIERDLTELAPSVEIHFERIAVTVEQIAGFDLPPTDQRTDSPRAAKFEAELGRGRSNWTRFIQTRCGPSCARRSHSTCLSLSLKPCTPPSGRKRGCWRNCREVQKWGPSVTKTIEPTSARVAKNIGFSAVLPVSRRGAWPGRGQHKAFSRNKTAPGAGAASWRIGRRTTRRAEDATMSRQSFTTTTNASEAYGRADGVREIARLAGLWPEEFRLATVSASAEKPTSRATRPDIRSGFTHGCSTAATHGGAGSIVAASPSAKSPRTWKTTMDKPPPLLTPEEIEAAVAKELAKQRPGAKRKRDKSMQTDAPPDHGDLPEIVIKAGEIERIVDETEAALIAEQETTPVAKRLFRRGGIVVSIGFNAEPTHDGGTVEAQVIVEAGDYALTERIASTAIFVKYNERKKKLVRIDPPHNIAVTLKQRCYNLKLPPLVALVNCPQFTANGQIMGDPGYNPKTGIFYDPRGVSFPPVPANPTSAEVKAALNTLKRLYRTFSFEAEIDRAVAISLPLTLVARTGLETSPLHAFDAPIAGSGKSKLVSIASIIATGHDAGVIAQGHTPEEFEKRLATQLMKGKQLIAIDNCNFPLDGDLLNQALTQGTLEMRILGQSRDVVTRCATVNTATGNNLIIVGDLTRRGLKGRLDPKVERPELQQFDYDPIADAKDNRGELVAAALTILRAYHVAGRPSRLPQLQSFAEWSDVVRSAMVWLDVEDPVKTQETLRENDPVLTALVRVSTAWRTAFGNETRTVSEVVADAEQRTSAGSYNDQKWVFANPIINEALMSVAGRNRAINPEVLGKYLGRSAAEIVDSR